MISDTGRAVVAPLRKRNLQGELYVRDAKTEAKLKELLALAPNEIAERACNDDRSDPEYIPSECLLYLVRASRGKAPNWDIERLYKALIERVLRSLPEGESADGRSVSLTCTGIREEVFGRFAELLAKDRMNYTESLDFFEVKFNSALAAMRVDAKKKAWREENRNVPIETDRDTGEISPEVERAAGSLDLFNPAELDRADYRSRLDEAIISLPIEQRTIIQMMRQNIPIDSKDPGVVTISKTLGKSEKTVRLHRDKALAALRAKLEIGKML